MHLYFFFGTQYVLMLQIGLSEELKMAFSAADVAAQSLYQHIHTVCVGTC